MALELSIVAVAINLPAIWVLFAKAGPETIVRSVRDAISLASIGSNRSNRSHGSHGSHNSRAENTEAQRSAKSISPSSALPIAHFSKLEDREVGFGGLETAITQSDATVTKR